MQTSLFCYSPWTNIDFSPTGEIAPCCKFDTNKYDQQFTIQNNSVEEYANSEFLKQIKRQFLQGTWPDGCERCQIEEQNKIESKRQLDVARWHDHYQHHNLNNTNFITSSIAFGNTCNLTCITCSPHSSSKWQQEYKSVYGVTIQHHKFYKNDFVNDFVRFAPNIVHIDIPGGEPFLSGVAEQKQLLRHYINSGKAEKISLHYTTNATVFPDQEWWQLWQHFREIDLQLSIDGIGPRYEYIRFPANWHEVNQNIDQYLVKQSIDNVRLSVSHTVSAYNIFYLDEFVTWCYNKGLPRPWMGRVHNPAHMRPGVWPSTVKSELVAQLQNSQWDDVKLWAELLANTNDENYFDTFRTKLHQHDQYRKLSFSNTFPELATYI